MASDSDVHFWLWVVTVATAVIAGVLSVVGTVLQRKEAAGGSDRGFGFRVILVSYGFMTASMVVFAARGLL
jgi:hypothetical protein